MKYGLKAKEVQHQTFRVKKILGEKKMLTGNLSKKTLKNNVEEEMTLFRPCFFF